MQRIRLIHWNENEAEERARLLQNAGYEVICRPINPAELRSMRETPPQAVIIDLSRLPSQGRDMGVNLRIYKSTRAVPLIFVEGSANKVDGVKKILPDATYTTWEQVLLWFVRSQAELQDGIGEMREQAGGGGLWIIWPKMASGMASDLTQKAVRETGLANGLVDFKICSVDDTWSGLRFTQRK